MDDYSPADAQLPVPPIGGSRPLLGPVTWLRLRDQVSEALRQLGELGIPWEMAQRELRRATAEGVPHQVRARPDDTEQQMVSVPPISVLRGRRMPSSLFRVGYFARFAPQDVSQEVD